MDDVNGEIILRAIGISKMYPGTKALNKVDFNVYKGKVNVLIGENGAGKSTLMKILAGIEKPSEGAVYLADGEIAPKNTREAMALGIGIIHQELNLFNNLNIYQNIFMGYEKSWHGLNLDNKTHRVKTAQILEKLEHPIPPETSVGELRVGQRQIVEIAKTMAHQNLHVLIMDEPTSSLSSMEVEVLFKIIAELKEQGLSIIYISHRMEEIMRVGDYVTILRDGNLIAEEQVKNIDIPWIVERMVGHVRVGVEKRTAPVSDEEILRVENLSLPKSGGGYLLDSVSFHLRKGEILGLYGLMGAGRTEIIECVMGMRPESSGQIYLDGKPIQAKSISGQIKKGFAHLPEDRQREGLISTMTIGKNMTLSSLAKYTKFLFHIIKKHEERYISNTIKKLYIKVTDHRLPILSLSGGNQQKVVIGKGILTEPKILLMDEPTRGIDVSAKADVFRLVQEFASQGIGILLIASELKEIISIADRIIVLSGGIVTAELSGEQITEQALVKASGLARKTAG